MSTYNLTKAYKALKKLESSVNKMSGKYEITQQNSPSAQAARPGHVARSASAILGPSDAAAPVNSSASTRGPHPFSSPQYVASLGYGACDLIREIMTGQSSAAVSQ